MKSIIIAISIAVAATGAGATSINDQVEGCATGITLKAIGWSALYGAGVMGGGAALAVAISPAGTVVAPVAAVVGNTVLGGLVGAGSGAVNQISIMNQTGINAPAMACLSMIMKEKSTKGMDSLLDRLF